MTDLRRKADLHAIEACEGTEWGAYKDALKAVRDAYLAGASAALDMAADQFSGGSVTGSSIQRVIRSLKPSP